MNKDIGKDAISMTGGLVIVDNSNSKARSKIQNTQEPSKISNMHSTPQTRYWREPDWAEPGGCRVITSEHLSISTRKYYQGGITAYETAWPRGKAKETC